MHLREALTYCDAAKSSSDYASVLNNLGNSLRDLGHRTANEELLEEAIACYDQALPFRDGVMLRNRTLGNKAAAETLLRRLREAAAVAVLERTEHQGPGERGDVVRLLHMGQEIMTQAASANDSGSSRPRAAASRYLQAASLLTKDTLPGLRAEVCHHLGGLFTLSEDDDELWTGLCFVSAAQRLSAGLWSPSGEARLRYHRGLMLMKLGSTGVVAYLSRAEDLLRQAVPELQRSGLPGESAAAASSLRLCSSLLAACGEPEAERRAVVMHAENEVRRVHDAHSDVRGELAETYRRYWGVIERVAPGELRDKLGRLALDTVKSMADRTYDEYNHAEQLIDIARNYRDLGDLDGALKDIEAAEQYARLARHSAPSVWCDLAVFFVSVPQAADAARCVRRAQELMTLVADDSEAVLPGNSTGRWIAESTLEGYEKEIERTRACVAGTPEEPAFDPAKSSVLLAADSARRTQIEHAIRQLWRP